MFLICCWRSRAKADGISYSAIAISYYCYTS